MFKIRIILTLFLIPALKGADLELRRFYKIQNADSTILTVGGEVSENVKIITQDPNAFVRDPKIQSFWIGSRVGFVFTDQSIYEISPAVQNGVISLVLEEIGGSKVLTQQIRHFRNSQWWKIVDAGSGIWQIINDSSNHCLTSRGNGNQVIAEDCDIGRNQSWYFHIDRKGDSFP